MPCHPTEFISLNLFLVSKSCAKTLFSQEGNEIILTCSSVVLLLALAFTCHWITSEANPVNNMDTEDSGHSITPEAIMVHDINGDFKELMQSNRKFYPF